MIKKFLLWIKTKFTRKPREVVLSYQEKQERKIAELKDLITKTMGWDTEEWLQKKQATYGPPFSSSVTRKKIRGEIKICVEDLCDLKIERAELDLQIAMHRMEKSSETQGLRQERTKISDQMSALRENLHGLMIKSSYVLPALNAEEHQVFGD